MTNLLTQAFNEAQNLPEHLQDELAKQMIEDIESELKWQRTLSQRQSSSLDELARQALNDSFEGKTIAVFEKGRKARSSCYPVKLFICKKEYFAKKSEKCDRNSN